MPARASTTVLEAWSRFASCRFKLRAGEISKAPDGPFQAWVAEIPVVDTQVPGVSTVG